MAKLLAIVQLGKGTVGGALVDQVALRREALRGRLGVDLAHVAIAGRRGAVFESAGFDLKSWRERAREVEGCRGLDFLREAAAAHPGPKVLVDATAAEGLAELYCRAFDLGFHIVSLNKAPLAGSLGDYERTKRAARMARRLWLYEVTVGAGLPVLGTVRDMVETGDRIVAIEGCFSGTLNFLATAMDGGRPFSEALAEARRRGYTEPDPREDLSGRDVARKTIILAREAGFAVEPSEVRLEPFCILDEGGPGSEVSGAAALDAALALRWREAGARGMRPRYLATVGDGCSVALREVPADAPPGRLAGPDNVFVFRTGRYDERPLVVAGPGAGAGVTAAGAFADILSVARAVAAGGGDA
jgi:aspartokinase/homoserine dehydrogenase 1